MTLNQKTAKQFSVFLNHSDKAAVGPLLAIVVFVGMTGCVGAVDGGKSRRWFPPLPFTAAAEAEKDAESETTAPLPESQVATADGSLIDRVPGTNRLVGFVTGKNEDLPKAKQLYQQGDAKFKQATNAAKANRTDLFADAAKLFKSAGKAAEGSGLQQDALFMEGESLFFANDLNGARDAFEKLQKEFPRNRHGDRAAARLFSISKYWIDVSKSGGDSWYSLNLFDDTRPLRDADGHAIRVLDQIRFDDPTGKLADDATMAAAAEHIRRQQFDLADEFLTDLRETFTDSDHLFLAHLLGIRCKLEIYAGPHYSERVLDEADELVRQTRRRFPDKLKEQKYNEMLARAAAEIAYHKAEKLAFRANYREKQREFGAARELYRKILRDHPTTPQAKTAREVLAKIEDEPDSPTKALAFLTKVFPSAKKSVPLDLVSPQEPASETPNDGTGKKLLR